MMFTDDDLKRLKEEATEVEGDVRPWITRDDVFAIIARLEAAEDCVRECDDSLYSPRVALVDAWRKVSGHESDESMNAWRKAAA